MATRKPDALAQALAERDAAREELARLRETVARLAVRLMAQRLARGRVVPVKRREVVESPWEGEE